MNKLKDIINASIENYLESTQGKRDLAKCIRESIGDQLRNEHIDNLFSDTFIRDLYAVIEQSARKSLGI